MRSGEGGAVVFLLVYGSLFLLAVRAFGLRRVVWGFLLVVVLAVVAAFRTLSALTGHRY